MNDKDLEFFKMQLLDLVTAVRLVQDSQESIAGSLRILAGVHSPEDAAQAFENALEPHVENLAVEPTEPEPLDEKIEAQVEQVNKDRVIHALKCLQQARGREAVKSLLGEFDARVVSDIDQGRYGELVLAARIRETEG